MNHTHYESISVIWAIFSSSSRNGRTINTSLKDASVNLITFKTYSEITRADWRLDILTLYIFFALIIYPNFRCERKNSVFDN